MYSINRQIAIIKPKEPYVKWMQSFPYFHWIVFVDFPVLYMQVVDNPDEVLEVHNDFKKSVDNFSDRDWPISSIERHAFYERAKQAYAVVSTSERRPYGCFILVKGVIGPDGNVMLAATLRGILAYSFLLTKELDMENVGACIDTGHAFAAYENVGESISFFKMAGNKLFHMHYNDNYSAWDDDMIVGSLRLTEFFEILFWLKNTNYAGWHSMDQYPYREDGYGAIKSSVLYLQKLESILESVGMTEVEDLVKKRDPIATSEFIRTNLIK